MRKLTAEEIELGNKEWANFGQYYAVFGDDTSLYEGLNEADDGDEPAADAGIGVFCSMDSSDTSFAFRNSVKLCCNI